MLNIVLRTFDECKPDVGRHVYTLSIGAGSFFDQFFQKMGEVTMEDAFDEGEELMCVGEEVVQSEDHWCYVDDIDPKLKQGYFYVDWKQHVASGKATLKIVEKRDDWEIGKYTQDGKSWEIHIRNQDYVYQVDNWEDSE